MKELFEEKEPKEEKVEEKQADISKCWVGRVCSFCGGTEKLHIFGNGLVKCIKCYGGN